MIFVMISHEDEFAFVFVNKSDLIMQLDKSRDKSGIIIDFI